MFNIFVELADDVNDKNDDIININIFQKNSSSIRPMMSTSKSINGGMLPFIPLNYKRDSELSNSSPRIPNYSSPRPSGPNKLYPIPSVDLNEEMNHPGINFMLPLNSVSSELTPAVKSDALVHAALPVIETPRLGNIIVPKFEIGSAEKKNYNDEVEKMLEDDDSGISEPPQDQKNTERPDRASNTPGVNIRRHRKKSKKQIEVLESYFKEDEEWSLVLVEQLAKELNLEKDQVYKWNWDKRKRLRKKAEREGKVSHKRQRVR